MRTRTTRASFALCRAPADQPFRTPMLYSEIAAYIAQHRLLEEGARVLVGVSGGVDSVVLLHVLHRLGYGVRAAHVNYGLRGVEADQDEAFVRDLCRTLGVDLDVAHLDPRAAAEARDTSVQAAARELRYAWFEALAESHDVTRVAVAHHLDDQAETVLLNLFRGSGPEGLAGMRARRPIREGARVMLVRPLLAVRRAAIEAFARSQGLGWRVDASNASLAYRRGALREAILPLITEHFGQGVLASIARSADLVRGYVDETLQPSLAAALDAAAEPEGEGGSLALEHLEALAPVWRHRLILEALRRWMPGAVQSRAVAASIGALVAAQPGRKVAFPQGEVWRERDRLLFRPAAPGNGSPGFGQLGLEETVHLPAGSLRVEPLVTPPERLDEGAPDVAMVDADRLTLPLTVRPWRDGDRFQPLGMAHSKKISDFLTDARVPSHERRRVLVVLSGEDVVWVVGHRVDHRFRVRAATRAFAKILFFRSKTGGGAGRNCESSR